MLCPSCGSDQLRSVSGVSENAATPQSAGDSTAERPEPRQRDVDKCIPLIGVFGIIGIGWHIFWVLSAVFLFIAIRDLRWNTITWPLQYAAWARLHECKSCGYIGPPEGPPIASAQLAHGVESEPPAASR
jgi:hypothetical protein